MEPCRVLVVEDDETARKQLAKSIRKEGYEVLAAENGREGVELFKKESPEIVITDLKMPGIDGLEVMHTVRRLSPEAQIIVITAFGETDSAVSALREGALDYLKKPLDLDQLGVALGRATEKVQEYKKAATFPTLLLAEDQEKPRERLTRVLEKEGWKVLPVTNGEEAVELFEKSRVDLAILDIKMPKKDGLQALHEMREISDDFEAIILTGYGDESSAVQALRDGAINFLKKPIDLDQMILAVEKALEKLNADRALKYRTRELELATQIIGTVTEENRLLVNVRQQLAQPTREFAEQLLDAMPICLFVLDDDLSMLYMNRTLAGAIDYEPEKLDDQFLKSLTKMGVKEITYDDLVAAINRSSGGAKGAIETVRTGEYSYLMLVPVKVAYEREEKNTVLIVIRGER